MSLLFFLSMYFSNHLCHSLTIWSVRHLSAWIFPPSSHFSQLSIYHFHFQLRCFFFSKLIHHSQLSFPKSSHSSTCQTVCKFCMFLSWQGRSQLLCFSLAKFEEGVLNGLIMLAIVTQALSVSKGTKECLTSLIFSQSGTRPCTTKLIGDTLQFRAKKNEKQSFHSGVS